MNTYFNKHFSIVRFIHRKNLVLRRPCKSTPKKKKWVVFTRTSAEVFRFSWKKKKTNSSFIDTCSTSKFRKSFSVPDSPQKFGGWLNLTRIGTLFLAYWLLFFCWQNFGNWTLSSWNLFNFAINFFQRMGITFTSIHLDSQWCIFFFVVCSFDLT